MGLRQRCGSYKVTVKHWNLLNDRLYHLIITTTFIALIIIINIIIITIFITTTIINTTATVIITLIITTIMCYNKEDCYDTIITIALSRRLDIIGFTTRVRAVVDL